MSEKVIRAAPLAVDQVQCLNFTRVPDRTDRIVCRKRQVPEASNRQLVVHVCRSPPAVTPSVVSHSPISLGDPSLCPDAVSSP